MRTLLLAAAVLLASPLLAAPPLMKPILQINLEQGEGKPDLVLKVYDAGQFRRADFETQGMAGLDQVFWTPEQWTDFQKLLKSRNLPDRGTRQLSVASPSGKEVRAKIEEIVVLPARAARERRAQEEQRQRDLKERDKK